MSHLCEHCFFREGRSRTMHDEVRHLHELGRGAAFHFEGEDQDQVFILESIGLGRVMIVAGKAKDRGLRAFTTGDGRRVEFLEGASSTRQPCSPTALVVPVP